MDRAAGGKTIHSKRQVATISDKTQRSNNLADVSAVPAAAAMQMGLDDVAHSERPSSRGGREASQFGERPGTRGRGREGRHAPSDASDGIVTSSWGSSMFASGSTLDLKTTPSPDREAPAAAKSRPQKEISSFSSRREHGGRHTNDKDGRSLRLSKVSEAGSRHPPSHSAMHDDGELEQIMADIGGDESDAEPGNEADDAAFERWMQQDPDAEIPESGEVMPHHSSMHDIANAALESPYADGDKSADKKKKKKERTPEETERKRGEIVDFYLERMVRELEKEVDAMPEDFSHLNFFRRKPLKEAKSIMEKILKRAWAKIEVEIRVKEIAQIEEQVEAEVDLLMQKGGEDWRAHIQDGLSGLSLPDATEQLQDEVAVRQDPVVPRSSERRASSDLDEEYRHEDPANIALPEDPLHALVAAHTPYACCHAKQSQDATCHEPESNNRLHAPSGRDNKNKKNLVSAAGIQPTMAHYARERFR